MVLRAKIFLIALIFGFALHAQENSWNVNFVNPEYVLTTSEIGREINRRAREREVELRQMDAETSQMLNDREEELTNLRDTMSIEEFTPLAEEFDQRSEYERKHLDELVQQEAVNRQAQIARLLERIRSEVIQFSAERGVDAVIDSRQVLAYNTNLDVSELIVSRLNEDYNLNKDAIDREIFAPVSLESGLTAPSETGASLIENQTEAPANEP